MTPDVIHQRVGSDPNGSESLALPANEIHLWLTDYQEIDDVALHHAYRRVLNDTERLQEPRFYFERDRRRYLVTRALIRTVLSRYGNRAPEEWTFATNAYGRPEIAERDPQHGWLRFNISHTHSMIVLGVARGLELGVDVENVQAREACLDVADHYFAKSEVLSLAALPQHRQHHRFFEHWTFKESYIKARGMGLSLPLDRFGFYFPDERAVEIDIHPELGDKPARWQFWQFKPSSEYLLAVCAERSAHRANVVVRRTVPMKSESLCALEPVRVSGGNACATRCLASASHIRSDDVFNS